MNNKKIFFPILFVLILWLIFIFPSCYESNWAYLDDPTTIFIAKNLLTNLKILIPDGQTGRYFPVYWLYYGIIYLIVGNNPFGFYFFNSFIFLITIIIFFQIVKNLSNSYWAAIFGVFLIISSSSVAENIYTISKAEPRLLLFVLLIIYMIISLHKYAFKEKKSYVFWITINILTALAILIKEVSIVLVVIPFGALIITKIINKFSAYKFDGEIIFFKYYTASCVISIGICRAIYCFLRPKKSTEDYIDYDISLELIINNFKFYVYQQPDLIIFAMISAILIVIKLYQIKQKRIQLDRNYIITFALFLFAVAYFFIILIWRWPNGYYNLVPVAIFSIVIASIIFSIRDWRLKYFVYILIFLVKIYSMQYFLYIACSQKFQDKIYAQAVNIYMQNAKPDERLLVEQWPFYVEPVKQTNILIRDIYGKKELAVEGILDVISNIEIDEKIKKMYMIDNVEDKMLREPREGDFVLAFTGDRRSSWILRGIAPYYNNESLLRKEIDMRLINAEQYKLSFFKLVHVESGYKLYKIEKRRKIIWEGRYEDKWMGKTAKLKIIRDRSESLPNVIILPNKYSIPK